MVYFYYWQHLSEHTFTLELFNYLLKTIIQEPRPITPVTIGIRYLILEIIYSLESSTYGMPSSHSQFVWYLVGFFCILISSKVRTMNKRKKQIILYLLCGVTTTATAVSYSRLYLGYHTSTQIFAGSFIGFVYGITYGYLLIKVFDDSRKSKIN